MAYQPRKNDAGEWVDYVELDDDREIAIEIYGEVRLKATVLFYESGSPGGRFSPIPRRSILSRMGLCVIAYDRPGYGESDAHRGRSTADSARNVEQIADALGVERFGIFGRSGGVAHALASAALLGDRVTSVAGLAGIGPPDSMGFSRLEGMNPDNVAKHTLAEQDEDALREMYEGYAVKVAENPTWFLDTFLDPLVSPADRLVIGDSGIRNRLLYSYEKAMVPACGTKGGGWADDTIACKKPWGFDVSDIRQPVLLWSGEKDVFAPPQQTEWLAGKIPNALLKQAPGESHFDAVPSMIQTMAWQKQQDK